MCIRDRFMFYECNGQRCNNGEVMSSDHHVIGSGFADDVNVINVTATDFHHQSILLRYCPFHLSFRGGSNMFLVKFSVLVMQRENQNDYWWFRDDQCSRRLTSNIVRGEIEFKFPIKNSPSGYPPLFEGLCIRRILDQSNHGHHIVSHHQRQNIGNHVCRRRLKFERYIKLDLIQDWRFSHRSPLIMFWDYRKSIEF